MAELYKGVRPMGPLEKSTIDSLMGLRRTKRVEGICRWFRTAVMRWAYYNQQQKLEQTQKYLQV